MKECPPAYNNCDCICHKLPKVKHVHECCSKLGIVEKSRNDSEASSNSDTRVIFLANSEH
jgi:hypothetical protein